MRLESIEKVALAVTAIFFVILGAVAAMSLALLLSLLSGSAVLPLLALR